VAAWLVAPCWRWFHEVAFVVGIPSRGFMIADWRRFGATPTTTLTDYAYEPRMAIIRYASAIHTLNGRLLVVSARAHYAGLALQPRRCAVAGLSSIDVDRRSGNGQPGLINGARMALGARESAEDLLCMQVLPRRDLDG